MFVFNSNYYTVHLYSVEMHTQIQTLTCPVVGIVIVSNGCCNRTIDSSLSLRLCQIGQIHREIHSHDIFIRVKQLQVSKRDIIFRFCLQWRLVWAFAFVIYFFVSQQNIWIANSLVAIRGDLITLLYNSYHRTGLSINEFSQWKLYETVSLLEKRVLV